MPTPFKNVSCQLLVVSCRNGFTIIELLVVFSAMAIISGVGFASLVAYSRSQVLNQTASEVKLAVEQTKFNALSSVIRSTTCSATSSLVSYTLIFCGASPIAACTAENISPSHGYLIQANCGSNSTVFRQKVPNVTISSTCSSLKFSATSGAFSATPGPSCTITITGYGNNQTVTVNSAGQTQ